MLYFKITMDGQVTAEELKKVLNEYAIMKLKTEGVESKWKANSIEVREVTK